MTVLQHGPGAAGCKLTFLEICERGSWICKGFCRDIACTPELRLESFNPPRGCCTVKKSNLRHRLGLRPFFLRGAASGIAGKGMLSLLQGGSAIETAEQEETADVAGRSFLSPLLRHAALLLHSAYGRIIGYG